MKTFRKFDLAGNEVPHFDYEELEVCGVGKSRAPMVSMDPYIDHSMDTELHTECNWGIAASDEYIKTGMMFGGMPPEEEERLQTKSWTSILADMETHDPTGMHRRFLEQKLSTLKSSKDKQAVYRYVYYAMGGTIPWFFALHLITSSFIKKDKENSVSPAANNFPLLMDYIQTLPFKEINRVLFLTTYPNAGIPIHRDLPVGDHKDHSINLFFDGGWRPSFIWDPIKKEKLYLEADARSYFFNNRDYHGVDAEPVFKYTLRVDGVFNDDMCDTLGLEEGYTWKTTYNQ